MDGEVAVSDTQKTEIPRDRWARFCQVFGRRHRGWLVEVTETRSGGQRRVIVPTAPLDGLKFSPGTGEPSLGGGSVGSDELLISLAATEDLQPAIVAIQRPQRLFTLAVSNGSHAGFLIDTPGDAVLELRFRAPAEIFEDG